MASGSQSLGTGYNNASTDSLGLISGATGGSPQGIYAESSTQEYPLGTRRQFEDGRAYRYSKAVAAITAAKVVSTDSVQLIAADTNGTFTAASAGAKSITVSDSTLGSATADLYAGAYFGNITNLEQYRIKGNTAASSNSVTFSLYDGIVTAVASSDDYIITPNPYSSVITATVGTGDTDYDRVVGIAPRSITSGYYFWLQTAGMAFALNDAAAAVVLGDNLQLSDSTAGTVQTQDAGYDTPEIGQAMGAAAASKSVPFILNIGG